MRKILLLILFFSIQAKAQTIVYKKIAQRHDIYSMSAWKGVDSFRWDYNSSALMTELLALGTDASNNWNQKYRYTSTFNSSEKLATQIRENRISGAWVNSTRYSYNYDAIGNLLTIYYDTWNGTSWNQTGKIEYAGYNSKGNYTAEVSSIWSGGAWVYLTQNLVQYYPNDYQVQFQEKYNWNIGNANWDPLERIYFTYFQDSIGSRMRLVNFGGGWLKESQELYTYSSAPILLNEYRRQTWDTAQVPNVWVDDRVITYSYNLANKLDKTKLSRFLGGTWYDELRSQYLYNTDTLLVEYFDENFSGSWYNNSRKVNTYAGKNVIEESHYVGSGAAWVPTKKMSYTFNINDLVTSKQIDTFNGASFYPNDREFYYYNIYPLQIASPQKTNIDLQLYPNPANEIITLHVKSQKNLEANMQIRDMFGKLCMMIRQSIEQGECSIQIPVNTLGTGNYTLEFTDGAYDSSMIKKFQIVK